MKSVDIEGYYRTDDGEPAIVYSVELHEGEDFDGKFNVQFAAVGNDSGDVKFAVVVQGQPRPFVLDWTDETRQFVTDLIDQRELVACINYENTDWEDPGGYLDVLMGRDLGKQFDVVQQLDLSSQDIAALREIRGLLDEKAA